MTSEENGSPSVGTVVSTETTPNSTEFSFIVDSTARKGQFVMLNTVDGKAIARISDIVKTNRYFQRAESVQEFERSGKPLTEMFPSDRWEYLVAEARVLGVYNDGLLRRSAFPASPGAKVYMVDEEILSKFFGMDLEKGLHFGSVEQHDMSVKLNMTRLLQKHAAILGISGSGKSYSVGALLEELLDREPEHGQVATVVIDTHGEYTGFSEDPNYANKTTVIDAKDFKIGVPGISSGTISSFVTNLSGPQKRELKKLLNSMSESNRGNSYDFKDVISKLSDMDMAASTKSVLNDVLFDLDSTGLFGRHDNPSIKDTIKPGHLVVVDISSMFSQRPKQILVAYLARMLFNARRNNSIPPFVLVVEEAHNFAPETAKGEVALARSIITAIAREGRKFHASLVLVSQRPIQLSTTALSQCNTHFILRVTNPYDIKHIAQSSEGITSDVEKIIPGLRVGEGIIVGEAVNFPLFLKVRERKSKKTDKGTSLENACVGYAEEKRKLGEDMDAFR